MAALLSTPRAAEGGQHSPDHYSVHLAHLWRSSDVPSPLRGGIFGSVGRSRRCASGHPKISDGGIGGPAGLALTCDDNLPLDRRGRVLGCVDGRPVSIGKGNNLVRRSKANHFSKELSYRKWRSDLELADLPEDVLRIIFSKLQYSELIRSSVLSSKWRRVWIISSRLSLDCTAIRGQRRYFHDKKRYTQQCIDIVNMVVHQFHGEVVEELELNSLVRSICIFSPLNFLTVQESRSTPNILSLASFLRASTFIEELEVHFDLLTFLEGPGWGTVQRLPGSSYKYLRDVLLTGFNSVKEQLEFLVHIVENAPDLKVLTIDLRKKVGRCFHRVRIRGYASCCQKVP